MKRQLKYFVIGCLTVAASTMIFSISEAHMESNVPFEPLMIWELERFHGHVGPFVVLGARMGEHAVTVHKIPRYFGLQVTVECPASPPPSCIIDGLQQSTGATYGKHNIKHIPADSGMKVTIEDLESGKKLVYTIKPEITALLKKWADEEKPSVGERGKLLFEKKPDELFNVAVIEK